MSLYQRGDVVSLAKRQLVRVTVLSTPIGPGPELYRVTLPINDDSKDFDVSIPFGATLNQIAAFLVAALFDQQTVYGVALGSGPPWEFAIAGNLGAAFTVTTSDNLSVEIVQASVAAPLNAIGEQMGPLRVVEPEGSWKRIREFATVDARSHEVQSVNMLWVRELGSGDAFDLDSRLIQTVLETVAGGEQGRFT